MPLNQKIYLGLASAGSNILQAMYTGGLMMFYLDVVHMDPVNYGIVFLCFAIWNAIDDPVFGYISDKKPMVPGKGKRVSFMWRAMPFLWLGYMLFWFATPSWDQAILFVFLLVALFFFDAGFAMYVLNHCAISTGMTDDPAERASISLVVTLVNVIPSAIVGFIPVFVLTSGFELWVIILSFSVVGAGGAILMVIGVKNIKENVDFYKNEKPLPLKQSIKITFQSRSFCFFVIYSFMMSGVAITLGTKMLFYFKYVFELQGLATLLPGMITGTIQIALYPIIQRAAAKYGVRQTLLVFVIVAFSGYLGLMFVEDFALMIFFYGCCGWGASCHWLLLNAMVGDIADEDELKTRQRREGAFFGVHALITAPALSIITWLFTLVIEVFGYTAAFGDSPNPVMQPNAILGIRLGVGLVPVVFLTVGFIFLYFFPLRGARYMELKKQIKNLHEKSAGNTSEEGKV